MPKICYDDRRPILRNPRYLEIVKQANAIIAEYQAAGFVLTLRQLYYQFVSRDLLENTQRSYKRLGSIIADGRMAGLIDWSAIEDRTRNLDSLAHWPHPTNLLEACAEQFRIDKWARQPVRIEVWIEKEALAGVFEGVCHELDVPFLCCRGYTSLSEMWSAAMRLRQRIGEGQKPIILHFGDHDPSGIDMSRDIRERLRTFGCPVEFDRLALNMDQVEQYDPPPNPAKTTDSRYASYIQAYGDESWELDALDPQVLAGLVRDAVAEYRDDDLWREAEVEEEGYKGWLSIISERYTDVIEFLDEE